MANPAEGGRYYLIDGEHVPAELVEVDGDPYGVLTPKPTPAAAEPTKEKE